MAYEEKDYSVDLNDEKLTAVKTEEKTELSELEQAQADALAGTEKFVTDQQNAIATARDEAIKNQQASTDFAIEKIEQQKEQAQKDYTKEQSAAYGDYQRQIDPYGVNAEQRASTGLNRSGYSESSKVSMYNTYQNRVASARASYELVVQNYNNGIREAQLQNDVLLAEIRSNAAQQQLEIALQGFQYKNQLILDFATQKTQVKNMYLTKWKVVLDQINSENALAEQQRQFKASHDLEVDKYNLDKDKWDYEKSQSSNSGGTIKGGSGGGSGGGSQGGGNTNASIDQTGGGNGDYPVDYDSLKAIGLGGRSASYINDKVENGYVLCELKNGKLTYRLNPAYPVNKGRVLAKPMERLGSDALGANPTSTGIKYPS